MLANKRGISYNAYIRYLLAKSIEVEMIHQSLPRGTHGGTVISNKDNYLFNKTHFFTITPSHHYCVQG